MSDLKERPVIQRTKDREYFKINQHCYKYIGGYAEAITDKEFRESTKDEDFETWDFKFGGE